MFKDIITKINNTKQYNMQKTIDLLYLESLQNKKFKKLFNLIFNENNINLAQKNLYDEKIIDIIDDNIYNKIYDKIIKNKYNPGVCNIKSKDKFCSDYKLYYGYPSNNIDLIIQQCILQILEPICEAKFSDNSYGHRPIRFIENALSKTYKYIQCSNLHHVVNININDFFNNVNHSKLIKQLWTIGIQDKKIISIIKNILKTPIIYKKNISTKGIIQSGLLMHLFCNVILNEFDHWIESQWQKNPMSNLCIYIHKDHNGIDHSNSYKKMRKTNLKEIYIIRYDDQFKIFCRNKNDAIRIKNASIDWFNKRLKLKIDKKNISITDLKKNNIVFLGYKIKVHPKKNKYTISSQIDNYQFKKINNILINQLKKIYSSTKINIISKEIFKYNNIIKDIHNYYKFATFGIINFTKIGFRIYILCKLHLKNRLIDKNDKYEPNFYEKKYWKSKQLKFEKISNLPILPIGYFQCKNPMDKQKAYNIYTEDGRKNLLKNVLKK